MLTGAELGRSDDQAGEGARARARRWRVGLELASTRARTHTRSSLGEATVKACMVEAIERWTFPKPLGGGTVGISYPFNLRPGPD